MSTNARPKKSSHFGVACCQEIFIRAIFLLDRFMKDGFLNTNFFYDPWHESLVKGSLSIVVYKHFRIGTVSKNLIDLPISTSFSHVQISNNSIVIVNKN